MSDTTTLVDFILADADTQTAQLADAMSQVYEEQEAAREAMDVERLEYWGRVEAALEALDAALRS